MTRWDVDRERLRQHVVELAAEVRPAESERLEWSRRYVEEHLKDAGWNVTRHAFTAVTDMGQSLQGVNLIARHPLASSKSAGRFCVGAHLDSRPDSPGADDNASAVAALLEIARLIPSEGFDDTMLELELVAFDLEENGMLGGAEHARLAKANGVDLRGMVSLEMLGYRDSQPGSQSLPKPLVGLYPDTGDFIAVIGNQNSTQLIERFAEGMRTVESLPVETLQVPENGTLLQATRLSDHSPFWDAGYPALMITDTSFMRNPHYHLPSDTPETLDWEFLGEVSQASLEAVGYILDVGL
jgi:Zn-dependent M28 family amino/carboxypeptidase